jgi:hypothetical protein
MSKSNVLDLNAKLNSKRSGVTKKSAALNPAASSASSGMVSDLSQRRTEKEAEERRRVTRTVLGKFVGVFVVVRAGLLQPVQIHDISTSGLSFDLPQQVGAFNVEEAVNLRIYMSHDTYFTFSVKIANVRELSEQGVFRHGAGFKKTSLSNEEALYHFVRFLETVSSSSKKR